MITAQDIHNATFEKAMRGYRSDDVDEFLTKVAQEIEQMAKEKAELEKKLFILAEKVDQYRSDEETLKTALINAQRLGETVVFEAKQKAETIIYDATKRASAEKDEAAEKVAAAELMLAKLQGEVGKFKTDVLNLYKQHIESLSVIPDEPKKAPAKKEAAKAAKEPLFTEESMPKNQRNAAKGKIDFEAFTQTNLDVTDTKEAHAKKADGFENYQGISFDD